MIEKKSWPLFDLFIFTFSDVLFFFLIQTAVSKYTEILIHKVTSLIKNMYK